MTVSELIDRLRGFDSHAEVYLQLEPRSFAPPIWVGLIDTAGLFDCRFYLILPANIVPCCHPVHRSLPWKVR